MRNFVFQLSKLVKSVGVKFSKVRADRTKMKNTSLFGFSWPEVVEALGFPAAEY